jgi:hypothetical protein
LLERLAVAVRQVSELHRLQNAIHDHRGAKTRSQAQEQHPAAPVAADRLHQRIVDDLRRAAERLFEIETGPPETEIVRLRQGPVVDHGSRISDRDDVIGPVFRQRLDFPYHHFRGKVGPGRKRAPGSLPVGHDLHARTADVDREDRMPRCPLARFLRHEFARLTLSNARNCSKLGQISPMGPRDARAHDERNCARAVMTGSGVVRHQLCSASDSILFSKERIGIAQSPRGNS